MTTNLILIFFWKQNDQGFVKWARFYEVFKQKHLKIKFLRQLILTLNKAVSDITFPAHTMSNNLWMFPFAMKLHKSPACASVIGEHFPKCYLKNCKTLKGIQH